jgi:hypothetical protein
MFSRLPFGDLRKEGSGVAIERSLLQGESCLHTAPTIGAVNYASGQIFTFGNAAALRLW